MARSEQERIIKITEMHAGMTSAQYLSIYSKYSYLSLSKKEQKFVNSYVDLFLVDGQIGADDLLPAAPDLFATQPDAAKRPSSRKEVLRMGEEVLNNIILADILLEQSQAKKKILLEEQYFILFHYLSRYWAVREKVDAVLSHQTELAVCYRNICESVKIIRLLQDNKSDVDKHFDLTYLNPNIPNIYKGFLNKPDEQQDSDYFVGILRRGNAIRLCWLWDRIVIEMFVDSAHNLLLPLSLIADQISWSLYMLLAVVHATGVFNAYFEARSNEERLKIKASEVFWAHLKLRRDVIVNDLIWGLANLACCFWLNGAGLLANIGDLITGVLLCMDLSMSIWRYKDDKKEYEDDIKGYNEQLDEYIRDTLKKCTDDKYKTILKQLKRQISINNYDEVKVQLKEFKECIDNDKSLKLEEKNELESIYWQLKKINAAKETRHNLWQDKKLFLYSDAIYAASLVLTFSVFCVFYLSFLPITMPVSMVMIGAISLGATTLIWRSANSCIELKNIGRDKKNVIDDFHELFNLFAKNHSKLSEQQQQQLYLKILQTGAQVGFQEDKLLYTKLEALRETLNRILIPSAIVLTFLFLPGFAFGVPTYMFLLIGVLVATVASSMFIKKYYTPKENKWGEDGDSKPQFIEQQFESFKNFITNEKLFLPLREKKLLEVIKGSRLDNNSQAFIFQNSKSRSSQPINLAKKVV